MANMKNDRGAGVVDYGRDTMDHAKEAVKDTASTVAQTAGDAAKYVGKKAEDATSAVGGGMKSLGETIRGKAPEGGVIGGAASAVAGTLESGGKYLQEHGLSGMGEDFTNLIRRNPLPAILVGIGVGFLIARATRS